MSNRGEGTLGALVVDPTVYEQLVTILDVEQILHLTFGDDAPSGAIERLPDGSGKSVFFVDDSAFARRKIAEVLDPVAMTGQARR